MAIIRVQDNKQITVALKYSSPYPSKPRNGNGLEYMYTLAAGDQIYVSAQGHAEIQSLKPSPGEQFILAKRVGAGDEITWSVERIPTQPKPIAAARSIAAGAVPIPPPSLRTRESIRIFNQLVATIQAAQAAEEFAKTIGREVRFDSADIRSMAISGFIEQSRRAA